MRAKSSITLRFLVCRLAEDQKPFQFRANGVIGRQSEYVCIHIILDWGKTLIKETSLELSDNFHVLFSP